MATGDFVIDVDDAIFDLRIFRGRIKLQKSVGAVLVVAYEKLGALGVFHEAVSVDVGETGAHDLVEAVAVGPRDPSKIGAVSIGGHEEDAVDFMFGKEGEDCFPFFRVTIPRVLAAGLTPGLQGTEEARTLKVPVDDFKVSKSHFFWIFPNMEPPFKSR